MAIERRRYGMKPRPIADRFWEKVRKGDGCWEWAAARHRNGYGYLRDRGTNVQWGAHRLSWTLHYGPIPDGVYVCHRCDNPGCVRPDHLFLGTNSENIRDAIRKGRHSAVKLNPAGALAIKEDRRSLREIARSYGVSKATVSKIRNGQLWARI